MLASIYSITCKDPIVTETYIGSSTDVANRRRSHKWISGCGHTDRRYNIKLYRFIREHGGWPNWELKVLDTVECDDRIALHKIERQWIEHKNSELNSNVAGRSAKESMACYFAKHKERLATRCACSCGGKYTMGQKSTHFKTKRHVAWAENVSTQTGV